ncbi:MAG: hypothetical protein LBI85_01925 [Spirochaetaceae bacterium]|jgi:hypothetical protein|nr:hypothetical protein [Spirochaetaceae bacterium]
MKKYSIGIAALALAIGVMATGCGSSDSGGTGTVKYTYSGIASGVIYTLDITGGNYVLTVSGTNGGTQTGTVVSTADGTITLDPSNTDGGQVTITIAGGGITGITVDGGIVFNNGGTAAPPATITSVGIVVSNEQIYGPDDESAYTGSGGDVYLISYDPNYPSTIENHPDPVGEITGGKLSLALPLPIDDDCLWNKDNIWATEITFSPSTLKANMFNLDIEDDEAEYEIIYGKYTETGGEQILYAYFSEKGTVKGSYTQTETWNDGSTNFTYTTKNNYNISGEKGWNKVRATFQYAETSTTATVTLNFTTAPASLSGYTWFLSNGGEEDGE